ncbi:hypothetical protein MRX96_017917 [Rhipicephalus microplus]
MALDAISRFLCSADSMICSVGAEDPGEPRGALGPRVPQPNGQRPQAESVRIPGPTPTPEGHAKKKAGQATYNSPQDLGNPAAEIGGPYRDAPPGGLQRATGNQEKRGDGQNSSLVFPEKNIMCRAPQSRRDLEWRRCFELAFLVSSLGLPLYSRGVQASRGVQRSAGIYGV